MSGKENKFSIACYILSFKVWNVFKHLEKMEKIFDQHIKKIVADKKFRFIKKYFKDILEKI